MNPELKLSRPHSQHNVNIFSRLTYAYTFPTFLKAYKKTFGNDDIPKVSDEYSASKSGDKLEEFWKEEKLSANPSILRAIVRAFGARFMVLGIGLLFDQVVLRLLRPFALIQLVRYFSLDEEQKRKAEGVYMDGGIIVATSFVSVFVYHLMHQHLLLLSMNIRTACSSLIYRKALKLSRLALRRVTIGSIINILSNDLHRIDQCIISANYLWITPIEIIITVFVLYKVVGLESAVGILFMVLLVPLQVYLARKCSEFRLRTAKKTDERVRLMSEIITGIDVIKMYAWEKPFAKIVENIRRLETSEIRAINYIKGFMNFILIASKISVFLAIITFVLSGNYVTAAYVYAAVSFYENLRLSLTAHFFLGIISLAELRTSLKRLQELLLGEENITSNRNDVKEENKPSIHLKEVSARWYPSDQSFSLNKINIKAEGSQRIGIVGPIGSGKSCIIHAILNELPLENGSINVCGKVSYFSQEPWIFTGNIQQNILLGQPIERKRYSEVLKVCALEQDLCSLPYGDQTLVGERGVTLSGGQKTRISLARAVYRHADIYLLDEPFSAVDVHVGRHLFEQCVMEFLNGKCIILITHQMYYLSNFDYIYLLDCGTITASGSFEQLRSIISIHSDTLNKHTDEEEGALLPYEDVNINRTIPLDMQKDQKSPDSIKEQIGFGNILGLVYSSYFKSVKSAPMTALAIALFILTQITFSATDYFIAYWVVDEQRASYEDKNKYLSQSDSAIIYTCLIICMGILAFSRIYIFFKLCFQISISLHSDMYTKIVNTTMNFFHSNYSGRILNRFSKDMGVIDELIPIVLLECIQIFLILVGSIVIIAMSNPMLLITTAVVLIVFYILRTVYVASALNIARIEGTARSPVYGHMSETIQGLTTIRASNCDLVLQKEFDDYQDLHSSVWYLHVACSRAFGYYTELVCVIYVAVITFSMVANETDNYGARVGLPITQGISLLAVIQWGLFQSSVLENQLTSVERVIEYTNLPAENSSESIKPPPNWPDFGAIRFISLSLRYTPDQPYVLKNINLTIESNKRIGIVGRTGAGKSSLISALFQLTSTEGTILIDEQDIAKMALQSLRSKISIIPQHPLVFSGTLRSNLDPFCYHSDQELWTALEDIQLKSYVCDLPLGLNHVVSDGGSNFSVGQKQLLCLGRAILRKNKILVLDEATASVDLDTDTLLQNTIRTRFAECTILTIAHRLDTIIDSDKVLVMEDGEVIEYDHPHILLQIQNGMFYSMVQQTGPVTAKSLTKIAEDSYSAKNA